MILLSIATERREPGLSGLVFQPTRRHSHRAVASENGIDFGHIGVADLPAESAKVFTHFSGRTEADQCSADDRIAQCPAQGELRQALAVFGSEWPQLLDGSE